MSETTTADNTDRSQHMFHGRGQYESCPLCQGERSAIVNTVAWGPTARTIKPHRFVPGAHNPRWCFECDYSEHAYQHASAEERSAFDEQQAAEAAQRETQGRKLIHRRAEINERDWIIHALAGLPGFSLEQLATGPAPVSFRYYRGGRYVNVQITVEAGQ